MLLHAWFCAHGTTIHGYKEILHSHSQLSFSNYTELKIDSKGNTEMYSFGRTVLPINEHWYLPAYDNGSNNVINLILISTQCNFRGSSSY